LKEQIFGESCAAKLLELKANVTNQVLLFSHELSHLPAYSGVQVSGAFFQYKKRGDKMKMMNEYISFIYPARK